MRRSRIILLALALAAATQASARDLNQAQIQAWCDKAGLSDALAGQLLARLIDGDEARSLAFADFLAADPEAFLANPAPFLRAAAVEAAATAPAAKRRPFTPKAAHACLDLPAAAEADSGFSDFLASFKKVKIGPEFRIPVFKMALAYWAEGIRSALSPPCADKPGLVEDFDEGYAPKSLDIWTDHGVRASAYAVLDTAEHYDGNASLKLYCEPKGWGADYIFKPNYVRKASTARPKTLVFYAKTLTGLDLHISLHEPDGDWEWKETRHLKPSPDWQPISLALADLNAGKKHKHGAADPDQINSFELLVGGPEGKPASVNLDAIYFK